MRLSWALVHSRQSEDVQRGIAMLEGNIYIYIYVVMLYFHCHDILPICGWQFQFLPFLYHTKHEYLISPLAHMPIFRNSKCLSLLCSIDHGCSHHVYLSTCTLTLCYISILHANVCIYIYTHTTSFLKILAYSGFLISVGRSYISLFEVWAFPFGFKSCM